MTSSIVSATIRVTVTGPAGRVDLAVPLWVDVATLSRSYADLVGDAGGEGGEGPGAAGQQGDVVLTTGAGAVLDPTRSVEESGLRHGDVLVAFPGSAATRPADQEPTRSRAGTRSPLLQPVLLVLAAVCGVGAAAVVATSGGFGPGRLTCLLLLAVCALVAAAPLRDRTGGPVVAGVRARTAASPAFAAGAGFVAAYSPRPGGLLLGLAVGALAATVFAAAGRTFLDDDHDEIVEVWMVATGIAAVLSVATLLVGATPHALWAVVFAAAVVAARLLPYTVVDVPDDVLLDLDRLAVTAWSAREEPRGSRRRRNTVRIDGVTAVVRRGLRLMSAGTMVVAVAVAATGPLLTLEGGHNLEGVASLVMVGLGGAALALVARSFRSRLPRVALRVAAVWVLAFLGVFLVRSYDGSPAWWWLAGSDLVAVAVTVSAVSLGRGWRSIWWARVADVVEGLAVVLVVASVPLASGFYDVVRGFAA